MDTDQKAREGYHAALQMISYQGVVIWSAFQSLLTANAVLIALAGAGAALKPLKLDLPLIKLLTIILCVLGLIVCLSWVLITARNRDHYHYWFAWARRYEKEIFESEVAMIQRGEAFSNGAYVEEVKMIMGCVARLSKVLWLHFVVIAAFVVLWIYVFVLAISSVG
jgi:hypothetical protein